ncbi:MAG: flagellar motor protein MotB, partial [Chitinophagaceae bacterium]
MKNRVLCFAVFFLFCLSLSSSAQYDVTKVDKKAVALYEKAMELTDASKYKEAIAFLQQAVARDEKYIDAYLSIAGIYGQLKDYPQSVSFYEKAFVMDTAYTADPGLQLPYSINLAGKGDFARALEVVNKILATPNLHPTTKKAAEYRQKSFQFALDYAKSHPTTNYVFAPHNLGDAINSSESEYFPSMPIDGKLLVYTRRVANMNEDFFGSEKDNTGWINAIRLPGNINTSQNEGAQAISQDGEWLVFTGCNRQDGEGSCDLY